MAPVRRFSCGACLSSLVCRVNSPPRTVDSLSDARVQPLAVLQVQRFEAEARSRLAVLEAQRLQAEMEEAQAKVPSPQRRRSTPITSSIRAVARLQSCR